MPQASADFAPIGAGETAARSFNFAPALASGETIVGAPVCAVTVTSGIDATPQARVLSTPAAVGAVATVLLGTMQPGVTYQVLMRVSTSAGQVLSLWTHQACVAP